MSIREKVKTVLEQNGVYISDDWDEELEFDSITFISTIVGLEKEFSCEVPGDMLLYENFKTFNMYVDNFTYIMNNKNHDRQSDTQMP